MKKLLLHERSEGQHSSGTEVPQSIGAHRVLGVLGGGRTSVVYRAEGRDRGTALALKIARITEGNRAIEREYSLLARLNRAAHPAVVESIASGIWEGRAWYTMEYLSGGNLHGLGREPPSRPPAGEYLEQRLALALSLTDAIAFIHEHGIVHGDVSPFNVLLRKPGDPVITDFGVAAEFGAPLSGVSQRLGTPGYVAPERLAGSVHDFRADVYSLGCVLYELLAQRPVFISDRPDGLGRQHLEAPPMPPSHWAAELSPAIDALVLGMLEKDPLRRTAHAGEVAAEIARLQGGKSGPWQERVAPLFPARFTGRDEELRRLHERVAALLGGHGSRTLLAGESGIGKTRLVQEVTSSLATEAITVLVSSAGPLVDDDLAAPPALRRALGGFRAIFAELSRQFRSEALAPGAALAAYDPGISALFEPGKPPPLGQGRSKDSVYSAIVRCVSRLCDRRPLLLVIDDLESMDELTLGFLRSPAARELRTLPCLLLLVSNDEVSVEERANLDLDTILLKPLSALAIESMLGDIFAVNGVSADLLESARDNTSGNPLLILEFARQLREKRLVSRAADGRLTIAPARAADRPSFHPLAAAVAALDPTLAELAATAAILGSNVDPWLLIDVVRATGRGDDGDVHRALGELSARGILAPRPGGIYRFTHEAYRSACEHRTDETRRAIVHRNLAHRLSQLATAQRPHREIGLHWASAGQPARALRPLRIAARRAAAVLALDDAVWLLDTAFRLCVALPGAVRKYRTLALRIGIELLEALARVARHDQVFAVGRALLERIPPRRRLLLVRVHWLLAQAYRITGDYRSAEEQLDRADRTLGAASALRAHVERRAFVDLGLLRAFVHYTCRDLARLELSLKTLAPIIEDFAHPAQRASYFMWRANALAVRRQYRHSPAAVRFERRALALFRKTRGYDRDATMSQFDLAFMLLLGRGKECREALSLLEDAALRCEHLSDAVLNARISTYRAVAHRRLRQAAECRALAERALVDSSACRLRGYMGAAKACLAWADLRADSRSEARKLAEDARSLWSNAKRGEDYPFQWLGYLPLLALAASEDSLDEARTLILELIQPTQQKLALPVDDALTRLAAEWEALTDAGRGQGLQKVIRLATEYRYL